MSPIVHVVGWVLIHFVWQGTALALATALALRGCSRSATRYLVTCCGLAAMLAAPLATLAELSAAPGPPVIATDDNNAPAALVSGARAPAAEPPLTLQPAVPPVASLARAVNGNALMAMLVIGWLACVAVLFGSLAVGWWRVRRMHAGAMSQPASRWLAAGERLARLMRLSRVPHIVDSPAVDVPTVVGWLRPLVLLPVAALANLTTAQVEAILAHELAHVRRHDYLVNVLQTLCETLLFYHPAVWWVSARVRAEREHCCDEIAVEVCGDAAGYARALVELESWRVSAPRVALAATGGPLFDRVRRIMRAPATDAPGPAGWIVMIALVALFSAAAGGVDWLRADAPPAAVVATAQNLEIHSPGTFVSRAHVWLVHMVHAHLRALSHMYFGPVSHDRVAAAARLEELRARQVNGVSLPAEAPDPPEAPEALEPPDPPDAPEPAAVAQQPAVPALPTPPTPPGLLQRRPRSLAYDVVTRDTSFICFGIPCAHGVELRASGTFAIKDDLSDLESLSDGGFLTLRVWSLFIPHTIEIRSEGGQLVHRYFVAGLRRRYDDEARRLLASELPALVRRTALGASSRTRQILAARGPAGVFDEITRLETDFARGAYFRELFAAAPLDDPTLARALAMTGNLMSSDFERSRTLRAVAPHAAANTASAQAYVAAVDRFSSDFEHRRVLVALLRTDAPSPAVRQLVAHSAERLSSDFEKSNVLRQLLASGPLVPADAVFVAVRGMSSDYEKSRVLRQLVSNRALPLEAKKGVLQTVPSMSSDFEQSRVLVAMLHTEPLDSALRGAFLDATDHIGSSFEQNRVLAAYVKAERR